MSPVWCHLGPPMPLLLNCVQVTFILLPSSWSLPSCGTGHCLQWIFFNLASRFGKKIRFFCIFLLHKLIRKQRQEKVCSFLSSNLQPFFDKCCKNCLFRDTHLLVGFSCAHGHHCMDSKGEPWSCYQESWAQLSVLPWCFCAGSERVPVSTHRRRITFPALWSPDLPMG